MAVRACALSPDVLRAALGCVQLIVQARSAFSTQSPREGWAVLLGKDWGFAMALACHIGWLVASAFGAWPSGSFCCAARVAPKVSLLAQLLVQQVVPPTAGWLHETWHQRYKLCWKAMAEVFVYTCAQLPSSIVLMIAMSEAVCTGAIWARMYILENTYPAPAVAAAHVLLRLSLSLCVHYCQRRANLGWAREIFSSWWPQLYQKQLSVKDHQPYEVLRSHTPVYSSILCCSNPTMLSNIAAASAKDLEPVHLERLSAFGVVDGGAANRQLAGTTVETSAGTGSMQAYDLARQLVSSAGASGSVSADGSSYIPAARKVRVSVKIPDRSPEDLPPGWDTDLQINSQRRAVVLFTYIRRGCIQLVLDLFTPAPSLPPAEAAEAAQGAAPAPGAATVAEKPEARDGSETASSAGLTDQASGLESTSSGSHLQASILTSTQAQGCVDVDRAGDRCLGTVSLVGGEVLGKATAATSAVPRFTSGEAHGQLLQAICSEALFAGRTLTVQVGATANLVRLHPPELVGACSQHVEAEQLPAQPPNVHVWQQVVCTGGSLSGFRMGMCPERRREVVLACSWDAEADYVEPPLGCTGASIDGVAPSRMLETQLTVRQQGQFLPVAHVDTTSGKSNSTQRRSLRTVLATGNLAVPIGTPPGGATALRTASGMQQLPQKDNRLPLAGDAPPSAAGARVFAFIPSNTNGLAEVELSRGGVHSPMATSVLLVSSSAIAFELEQLQAAANGGINIGSATRPSMVVDVIRDFGIFMDIIPGLSGGGEGAGTANGVGTSTQPVIEWSLAPAGDGDVNIPVPTHVTFVRQRLGCTAGGVPARSSDSLHTPVPAPVRAGSANTDTGVNVNADNAGDKHSAGTDGPGEYQRHRTLTLASVGCRLGLNLLRYFLSTGMPACAKRVLDVLHHQLGVPVTMLAGHEWCHERLTLLHHAARSGSFRTVAAVAVWMEEHGVDPGWDGTSPNGLTPLHLLAVVPGSQMAATLLQLRWPAAHRTWHSNKSVNATPAQFASIATGCHAAVAVPYWWQYAMDSVIMSWTFGGTWRCLAAMRKWSILQHMAPGCVDIFASARGFMLPSLESSYEAWLNRRVAFMDHLFLSLYTAYFLAIWVKGGWAFFTEHVAGLILLVARLSLLALHSPLRAVLSQRLMQLGHRGAPQGDKEGREESGNNAGIRRCGGCLLTSREGTVIVLEQLRMIVMLLITFGVFPLPRSWIRLVQLRLDFIINAIMRPTANQMRLLPSFMAAMFALTGEVAITTIVLQQRGMWASSSLMLAFARGALTHGLGLSLTALLQISARGRFLAEIRGHHKGFMSSK